MADKELNITDEPVKCGHCSNLGRMQVLTKYNDGHLYGEEMGFSDAATWATYHAGTIWEVLICEACNKITVRSAFYDERYDDDFEGLRILYPEGRHLDGLPEEIRKAYDGALRVRSIDRNGYALLLRRTLEKVCLEQKANGYTLRDKLDDLAKREILPKKLTEVAHAIRSIGNEGAHAASDVEESDIPLLDGLSTAVLEYVYVAPYLVTRARERLQKRKPETGTS